MLYIYRKKFLEESNLTPEEEKEEEEKRKRGALRTLKGIKLDPLKNISKKDT